MDALDNILNRVSARLLTKPHPDKDEMDKVFRGALRAPDHAWLRPSSFIQVTGEGIKRLSEIFEEYGKTIPGITDETISKYKNAPYRAPMIIILINSIKNHSKVPDIEQKLSTAASAQNILLSLNALGYSAIWRTGKLAFNPFVASKLNLETNQEILGYIYVGTSDGTNKKIPELDIQDFVSYL
ncbi:nitroreductase [Gammaproteobacteria bacterium]|nr:nitroreductase [Gammaproteobacteria bacterium]